VYRENAKALSVRALAAAFPRVADWLGPEDFAGMAWAYARACPPTLGDAARWGASLPAFLADVPEMDPALPSLSRLDWALHQLGFAPDDPPPDPGLWDLLQSVAPERLRLVLSPLFQALHLPTFGDANVWQAAQAAPGLEEGEAGECVVVWRQGWRPMWATQSLAAALWCSSLQEELSLASALDQTLQSHPDFDLGAWLAVAWRRGWLLGASET
jgi:hypothetical protein